MYIQEPCLLYLWDIQETWGSILQLQRIDYLDATYTTLLQHLPVEMNLLFESTGLDLIIQCMCFLCVPHSHPQLRQYPNKLLFIPTLSKSSQSEIENKKPRIWTRIIFLILDKEIFSLHWIGAVHDDLMERKTDFVWNDFINVLWRF